MTDCPELIIRPVPAAVFALISDMIGFDAAFGTSDVPNIPGIRGVFLWASIWASV